MSTRLYIGTSVIIGLLGIGGFILYRFLNSKTTIYTQLDITDIKLCDGKEINLEIELGISLKGNDSHGNITNNTHRIVTQSCIQCLSPYKLEDIETKQTKIKQNISNKIEDNLSKMNYILLDCKSKIII